MLPFAGLARELAGRGHPVRVYTSGHFTHLFQGLAVEFVDIFAAECFRRVIQDPTLWEGGPRSLQAIMRFAALGLRRQFDAVTERASERPRLVCGQLALGARCAAEYHGLEAATIALAPAAFLSVESPPALQGLWMPPWTPHWFRHAQYRLVDAFGDRLLGRGLNEFRASLGMAPVTGFVRHWLNSPALTVALFPDWFGPPAPDWPAGIHLTDFPLHDGGVDLDPPAELQTFVDRCGPPIVFTPGSAMVHGAQFFAAAVRACTELGRPGLLLTGHREQLPAELPPTMRHFDYVPLSWLLPRSAALVHHGGIGTVSQALAAGVPQLVTAIAYDQPDNAARVARLGAGAATSFARFCAGDAMPALARLLGDPTVTEACTTIAARLTARDGLARACDRLTVERW